MYLKRRLVVQNLKVAWSKRFIPKLFVWHSSRDIVRMKWRYYRTGLYTEKKRSHWLKQWPIRTGLGDKKRWVVIGWRCNLDFSETLEQSTNGKFKRFSRSSRSKWILFVCREVDSEIWWMSLPGRRDEMECELERGQRYCTHDYPQLPCCKQTVCHRDVLYQAIDERRCDARMVWRHNMVEMKINFDKIRHSVKFWRWCTL